jgi:hypothetical protein
MAGKYLYFWSGCGDFSGMVSQFLRDSQSCRGWMSAIHDNNLLNHTSVLCP